MNNTEKKKQKRLVYTLYLNFFIEKGMLKKKTIFDNNYNLQVV